MRQLAAVLVSVLLSVGCGSEPSSKGGGDAGGGSGESPKPAPALKAESACQDLGDLHCSALARCGLLDPAQKPSCIVAESVQCERDFGRRLRAGALAIDPSRGQRCLEAFTGLTCSQIAFQPSECSNTFVPVVGNAATGEACSFDSDCKAGTCAGGSTCAACVAFLNLGDDCSAGTCAPTAYCGSSDGGSACLARVADGQPCSTFNECRSNICNAYPDLGGNRCGLRPVGQPCANLSECQSSRCFGTSSPDGGPVCQAKIPNGGTCDFSFECASPTAECINRVCKEAPYFSVAADGGCTVDSQCREGLQCSFTSGPDKACRPGIPEGATCNFDNECPQHTLCFSTDAGLKTCRRRLATNAPCDPSVRNCKMAQLCRQADGGTGATDTVCIPDPGAGQPCYQSLCYGAYCGQDGGCQAQLDKGVACSFSFECRTEACGLPGDGGPQQCTSCY